jgi:hypothetical protein
VVDDFGVSYSNQADVDHLIATLKANDYLLAIKDDGNTYLGMTIKFNTKLNKVNISMPGYLEKALARFRLHYLLPSHRAARSPGRYIPPNCGSKLPQLASEDPTDFLSPEQKKEIQAIVGAILYYARAVDHTLLPIANEIASQQAAPTQAVLKAANRVLSYCAAHLNNATTYHSYDMILHGLADASYLSPSTVVSSLAPTSSSGITYHQQR